VSSRRDWPTVSPATVALAFAVLQSDDPARPHWTLLLETAERVHGDWLIVNHWEDTIFKHSELLFGTDLSSARDFLLDQDEAPFWLRHIAYASDQVTTLFSDHRYLTDRVGARPPE